MDKHIDECAKVFLRDQKQLFDEPVAYDLEFLIPVISHTAIFNISSSMSVNLSTNVV